MPHRAEHQPVSSPLNGDEARELAETVGLFATASRLRLLWALLEGERTVDDLATVAELTTSAASHQLRLLREARLVKVRRSGRHAYYALHDHHVPELLAALRHHHEHVAPPPPADIPPERRASARNI